MKCRVTSGLYWWPTVCLSGKLSAELFKRNSTNMLTWSLFPRVLHRHGYTRRLAFSGSIFFIYIFLMTKSVIVSKLKADTKAMQKSSTNLRLTRLSRLQQSDITVRSRRPLHWICCPARRQHNGESAWPGEREVDTVRAHLGPPCPSRDRGCCFVSRHDPARHETVAVILCPGI